MGITVNGRSRKQLGQSIVELAIATPVLLFLILGAFDTSVMISDKVIAGAACRQGARLAAEIGGWRTNPLLTTAQVDANVVKNVLAVATAMNYSTLKFVYIYQPTQPDGDYHAGDPVDVFDATGANISSSFPLTSREQIPPNETPIGVRLEWQYNPPTGLNAFSVALSEHAVFRAAPVLS
jgi:hypothetical protein